MRQTTPPPKPRPSEAAKANTPAPEPEVEANPQPELPLRETPAPQIIDASQRRIEAPKPGDKPFERKQGGHLSLSTAGFEDYDLPGFRTVEHVCVLGSEKAAWFKDTEGNVLCLHEDLPPERPDR